MFSPGVDRTLIREDDCFFVDEVVDSPTETSISVLENRYPTQLE
jgi:hypothetical protein